MIKTRTPEEDKEEKERQEEEAKRVQSKAQSRQFTERNSNGQGTYQVLNL